MITVLNAASDKMVLALISAFLLTGVIADDYSPTEVKFDIYDYKIEKIDTKMSEVLSNPTDENINTVYYDLIEEMQWSHRHVSDRSLEYEAYLESCNDILINLSKEKDIIESHESNEHQINIDAPFIFVSGFPTIQA